MFNKRLFCSVVLALVMFMPVVAKSDGFRVATVDVNKVINGLPESKQKKAELGKLQQEFKKKLDDKKANIKTLERKFKDSGKDVNSAEAENVRKAIREYEEFARSSTEELQKKFFASNKELTTKVLSVIERYSKSHKLSLVLDKNDQGTSPLLYGDETVDITDAISRELR